MSTLEDKTPVKKQKVESVVTLGDPEWMNTLAKIKPIINDFNLDDGGANIELTFTKRFARDHLINEPKTLRILQEYRRFFTLMVIRELHLELPCLTPSRAVDLMWHQHLIYSRNYKRLCNHVGATLRESKLDLFIHHGPTTGGKDEKARYEEQYNNTLAFYEEVFNEAPPPAIWPRSNERFAGKVHIVDGNDYEAVTGFMAEHGLHTGDDYEEDGCG